MHCCEMLNCMMLNKILFKNNYRNKQMWNLNLTHRKKLASKKMQGQKYKGVKAKNIHIAYLNQYIRSFGSETSHSCKILRCALRHLFIEQLKDSEGKGTVMRICWKKGQRGLSEFVSYLVQSPLFCVCVISLASKTSLLLQAEYRIKQKQFLNSNPYLKQSV